MRDTIQVVSSTKEYSTTAFLNMVKAITTILVIIGHATILPIRELNPIVNYLWIILYLFHMPTFFMVSGYLYELNRDKYVKQGNWRFILSKFVYLMIPYYTYSIMTYIILGVGVKIQPIRNILESNDMVPGNLMESVCQILTHQNSLDEHVWFVFNLFLIFVTVTLIYRYVGKWYVPFEVMIIYIAISCSIDLPEIVRSSFAELVYFLIGMQFAKFTEKEINCGLKKLYKVFPLIVLVTLEAIVVRVLNQLGVLDLSELSVYGGVINKVCGYISGTVLGLTYIFAIRKWSETHESKILNVIYEYSYDIYLLHQPFIVTGISFVAFKMTGNSLVTVVASVVLGILFSIAISKFIIRKNKLLSFLFLGKKRKFL